MCEWLFNNYIIVETVGFFVIFFYYSKLSRFNKFKASLIFPRTAELIIKNVAFFMVSTRTKYRGIMILILSLCFTFFRMKQQVCQKEPLLRLTRTITIIVVITDTQFNLPELGCFFEHSMVRLITHVRVTIPIADELLSSGAEIVL